MKKIILLITAMLLLLISCKKAEISNMQSVKDDKVGFLANAILAKNFNVVLKNNRLVFNTIDDYKRVVDNPSKETADRFIEAVNNLKGFESYAEFKSDKKISNETDLFYDPYFESILNADKIVQIGRDLYKVDPANQKVLVLSSEINNGYADLLLESRINSNIKVYSTDENVLELVASGSLSRKSTALICGEGGIGSKADLVNFSGHQALAAFNKYGIYYSLFAEISPSIGGNQFQFEFNNAVGYIHYHARCGTTADYGITSPGNNMGSSQRYQSYQGSINLNNLFFGFTVIDASYTRLTRMVYIRQNW